VREDYSRGPTPWEYFSHDHARTRAFRWNEDGLLGLCDRHQRIAFALALWNGRDPFLKERLFGLTNHEGNHGEDVKECYFYLDNTPTHSYMKGVYKYPHAPFPYAELVTENQRRGPDDAEYELLDTGVFDGHRYFDVQVEYAKADVEDILIRIRVSNRGPDAARLDVLPTLLFTENETNRERLYGSTNHNPYVKDAFHRRVVEGERTAVNPAERGTKAAAWYTLDLAPGETTEVRLRLSEVRETPSSPFDDFFTVTFDARIREADEFYASVLPVTMPDDARNVARQAIAGLLWSKQFYHYVVRTWLEGDRSQPAPPPERLRGRNADWTHVYNDDVLSVPDKWEFPWYASWDLAFHAVALAIVDAGFAKDQLVLLLREWYMHPNGQLPAYEWAFGDVNPPVQAWAAWRVYKIEHKRRGTGDRVFLERVFQKLLLNFTWWVNRHDADGLNVFQGGFLGMDNVGLFDRSQPLPSGMRLEQSDATSWMAMYSLNMLAIAVELARHESAYEDVASKFWEHFVYIAHAMTGAATPGRQGHNLWHEEDGFFYDVVDFGDGRRLPLRIRSVVGLLPLLAVQTVDPEMLEKLPAFSRRLDWFVANRPDLAASLAPMRTPGVGGRRLLAIADRQRLERVLKVMLDEREFLSPYGIRSLSRIHADHPFTLHANGTLNQVSYEPAESRSRDFGGNSNWRGPVWFPVNYLIIEALQKYHLYYGDGLKVECPTGSGRMLTLRQVAAELSERLTRLFLRRADGTRPASGAAERYQHDPHWRDFILFHEYFHGDTGVGLGASHQTGWTALVANLLQQTGAEEPIPT
jgi:hypothetical protein